MSVVLPQVVADRQRRRRRKMQTAETESESESDDESNFQSAPTDSEHLFHVDIPSGVADERRWNSEKREKLEERRNKEVTSLPPADPDSPESGSERGSVFPYWRGPPVGTVLRVFDNRVPPLVEEAYRVIRPLGFGSYGSVFVAERRNMLAKDPKDRLPQTVIVKQTIQEGDDHDTLLFMAMREYLMTSVFVRHRLREYAADKTQRIKYKQMCGTDVACAIHIFETEPGGRNIYLVYPYRNAITLSADLNQTLLGDYPRMARRDRLLFQRRQVSTAAQLAEIFADLHDMYIFHRDLKPNNVMIENLFLKEYQYGTQIFLIDFGVACTDDTSVKHRAPLTSEQKWATMCDPYYSCIRAFLDPAAYFHSKDDFYYMDSHSTRRRPLHTHSNRMSYIFTSFWERVSAFKYFEAYAVGILIQLLFDEEQYRSFRALGRDAIITVRQTDLMPPFFAQMYLEKITHKDVWRRRPLREFANNMKDMLEDLEDQLGISVSPVSSTPTTTGDSSSSTDSKSATSSSTNSGSQTSKK